ncbi:MAG: glycosyltransferase family 4 protein, partial [Erysipelotrichaceae bacterium]
MNLNNDKLNILLISPLPPPAGGIATWTETYLKSQQFKEHSVSVVNTSIVGYRMTNFNKIKIFDEIGRNIRIYNQVMDNMKKVRYDIVHFNTSCSKFGMIRDHFCLKKIKKFENKLILQCHCNIPQLINTRAKKFLFSRIIKSADIIITLNTESNNYLEQQFKKKGVVFANFIDEGILPHEKSRIISEKINNVIFVGHIEKMKGLLEIIDVAKLMPHICFRMLGSISEDFNLDSIPDYLTFTGEVTQEIDFNEMNNADIFLFPSHSEG